MNQWQAKRRAVIDSFLQYLSNQSGGFVLKGGAALVVCYGLNGFSEDIALDSTDKSIEAIVAGFCAASGYAYRTSKDTDTVKRYMIDYESDGKPLNVEASHRRRNIDAEETAVINGVRVYKIDELAVMKTAAYAGNDNLRDIYDLCYICNNYYACLSPQTLMALRDAVGNKCVERVDYIIRTQRDGAIDESALAGAFLTMCDRLGLILDTNEKQILADIVKGL